MSKGRVNWTAENDQRLLLLLVNRIQVNYDQLSRDWAQAYGTHQAQAAFPVCAAVS